MTEVSSPSNNPDTLRLVLSGSVSIGKTTLAGALGDRLQLPVIDELFDGNLRRSTANRKVTRADRASDLIKLLRHKSALEKTHGSYISDRCALDLLHFWCFYGIDTRLPIEETEKFYKVCRSRIALYDFIVFPPWGAFDIAQVPVERKQVKRNLNRFVQLKHHAAMLGYAHQFFDKRRIIEIPLNRETTEQRTDFIVQTIARRRQLLGNTGA